jgi:hypothetical protein
MDVKILPITFDDEIRLKHIILDRDQDDAFKFAKELLGRITAPYNKRMKNYIDV